MSYTGSEGTSRLTKHEAKMPGPAPADKGAPDINCTCPHKCAKRNESFHVWAASERRTQQVFA